MKLSRALSASAAAAMFALTPSVAMAVDYGGVGPNEGGRPGGGQVGPNEGGAAGDGAGAGAGTGAGALGRSAAGDGSGLGLPSTGSTALDTAIGGAGLVAVLVGGSLVWVSRRRQEPTPA